MRGQVQTECNAIRDLFAPTTAAMESSQHDRRLNHKEVERHLTQEFGGNRVDNGDFACGGKRARWPRCGPASRSVDGSPRGLGDLCLLSRHRWAHTIPTLEGRRFGTPLAGFGQREWLRELPLEKVNKFNPRCVEGRLLGFCLRSSRYIVVDFDGRLRFVRTVKRTSSEGRWTIASPRDPFSAGDLG